MDSATRRLPTRTVFAEERNQCRDLLTAEVTVTNTGKLEGDEVAQLYLSFPKLAGAPLRALRGFRRVHLKPGESQRVRFELKDRDLSMVTEAGEPIIAGREVFSVDRRWTAEYRCTRRRGVVPGERSEEIAGVNAGAFLICRNRLSTLAMNIVRKLRLGVPTTRLRCGNEDRACREGRRR
jgi:hypothetical protein